MERVLVLLKRKPGLTFDEFRDHYEASHAKHGERYFGHLFASYRRNYIAEGTRFCDGAVIENAYDCVTELVFREVGDYAELRRIASDPEVQRVLSEDEAKFLDRTLCDNAVVTLMESDVSAF